MKAYSEEYVHQPSRDEGMVDGIVNPRSGNINSVCGHLTNSNAADSDVSLALVLRVMRSSLRLEPKTRLWLNPAPVRLYKADESWAEARAGPKVTSVGVTTPLRCMKERSHFCLYVTGFQALNVALERVVCARSWREGIDGKQWKVV